MRLIRTEVRNKDWLYQKYVIEKLSTVKIAAILRCSRGNVSYWLRQFNIPIRSLTEAWKEKERKYPELNDSEWLSCMYWGEKRLSSVEIAQIIGCKGSTVLAALRKFNIKTRSISESRRRNKIMRQKEKEQEAEKDIKEWLNETKLSEKSKEILTEETLRLCSKIEKNRDIKNIRVGEIRKVALLLACDNRFCAVPRALPMPKTKYLAHVRKALKIRPVGAIGRTNSIVKLLGMKEEVSNKAEELLLRCKNSYPVIYSSGSPTILAAAAIYISSVLKPPRITQEEIANNLSITTVSIRNIANTLSDLILGDDEIKIFGLRKLPLPTESEKIEAKCN